MVNTDLELKDEIDILRESLYSLLSTDHYHKDDILEASQELDEIIVKYLKRKLNVFKEKKA